MDWDQRHRDDPDKPPSPLVVKVASQLPPGKALDLACGTGRNASWLAQNGWEVTAVDSSPVALQRIENANLNIHTVLADLGKNEFSLAPETWDLIVVTLYLQRDLFARLKDTLRPGGVAIVSTLLGTGRFRLAPGELRAFFPDWEPLHDSETDIAEWAGRKP